MNSCPFDTLGVEPRFDLDERDLHDRFIRLSAAAHPDRFTDPLDQADAAEKSAAVNHAYRILKDPESRADALLVKLGGPAKDQDKSLPRDLLVEMMEIRETQEEAIAANDQQALRKLATWAADQRTEHLKRIADLFAAAPGTPGNSAALKQIRLELNALRYFERMIEQLPL